MAVGAVVARIISQYSDKGTKAAQRDIAKLGKNIDKFASRVTKSFAIATAASAAFAVKIGKDAVRAASEDSKSAAVLAQTLKNVTGATTDGIAAVEEYIEKQQIAAGVADSELRQSFAALTTATGNVSDAMYLQNIALDTAAGTGKDLQTVTLALVKAQNGNIGALKRLGIPLDESIVKSKDFAAATEALTQAYGGQAKVLADADPFKRLQLSYQEVLETLGYSLLPVIKEFVEYLQSDVLPQVERWVNQNKDELQSALKGSLEVLKVFGKTLVTVFSLVEKNKGVFIALAASIVALSGIAKISNAVIAIQGLSTALSGVLTKLGLIVPAAGSAGTALTVAGNAGAVAGTKATVAWSRLLLLLGRIALPITVIVTFFQGLSWWRERYKREDAKAFAQQQIVANQYVNNITSGFKSIEDATRRARGEQDSFTQSILDGFKPIEKAVQKSKQNAKDEAERIARLNKLKKEEAKADALKAKAEAKVAAIKKSLQIKGDSNLDKETDLVQLNAAEALLKRQKEVNLIDAERIKAMKEELLSLKVRNDLALRYQDILKVLADQKIDDKEIERLAKSWGIPTQAVRAYFIQFEAISDGVINKSEIEKLAQTWGSSEKAAEKYLDFYNELNDGFLSDAEIAKLAKKWYGNLDADSASYAVKQYGDFVGALNDDKLDDTEINKLQTKWNLTTKELKDYVDKIEKPVTVNSSLFSDAEKAQLEWKSATEALDQYLKKKKNATADDDGSINGNSPEVIAAAIAAANEAAKAAAEAAAIAAEAEAAVAEAEAAAAAASKTFLNAISNAKTTDAINSAVQVAQIVGESASDIANAMMQGLLKQGMDTTSAASSARYTGQAIAMQQAMQNATLGSSSTGLSTGAFSQNSTMNTAAGIKSGSLMAAPIVNITVQGSVTAEQDLVQAVRNGLLATQYNGNQLLLEAI